MKEKILTLHRAGKKKIKHRQQKFHVLTPACTNFENAYSTPGTQHKPTNALSQDLINKVQAFYERDDISRMSPNVKHSRKFLNPATGKKEIRQLRHLMFRLSEVYNLFIAENMVENGKFLSLVWGGFILTTNLTTLKIVTEPNI